MSSSEKRLIESVRLNAVLYDPFHPRFLDFKYKDSLWEKIGNEVGYLGPKCKLRWNSVRDNYRKALKKRTQRTGKALEKLRKYIYEDELAFLKPYFQATDSISSDYVPSPLTKKEARLKKKREQQEICDDEIKNEEKTKVERKTNIQLKQNIPKYATLKIDRIEESFDNWQEIPMLPNGIMLRDTNEGVVALNDKKNNKRQIASTSTKSAKRKYVYEQVEPESNLLIKYIIGKERSKESDAVEAFLEGLTPTLKSLSAYYLNIAKTKIFSAVQEVEMAMIVEKQKDGGK